MNYIQGVDRHQRLLFAEAFDDYIDSTNPVRFIDAFVSMLNLRALGFTHAIYHQTGRPPYNPSDLLKLYIYGYVNRIRSSRQLERATYQNIEMMWLIHKLHPDFKTIADFRKNNISALKKVCREFTLLCKEQGLFDGELVAIDGSKFSAVNHNSKCYTKASLERKQAEIDEKVAAYLEELELCDANEVDSFNPHVPNLQEKIAALKARKQELSAYQQHLDETGEKQIALTDPDSRMMRASTGRKDVSYNIQIASDAKHALLVAYDVTNARNDQNELSRMAIKAQEILESCHLEVVADGGYYNEYEIQRCDEQQITCFIPPPKKSHNRKLGLYTEADFTYDSTGDCYVCPAGQILTLRGVRKRKNRLENIYASASCRSCSIRSLCTRSKRNDRRIYRWRNEHLIEQMRERLRLQPEKVKLRSRLVEHPFGTLKRAMDQRYFLLKGKHKVSGEVAMSVLAYNIKRVTAILGVPKLLEALRTKAVLLQERIMNHGFPLSTPFCVQHAFSVV